MIYSNTNEPLIQPRERAKKVFLMAFGPLEFDPLPQPLAATSDPFATHLWPLMDLIEPLPPP